MQMGNQLRPLIPQLNTFSFFTSPFFYLLSCLLPIIGIRAMLAVEVFIPDTVRCLNRLWI